jgi:acetolactate synthase I/II/III large subunit
VVFAEGAWTMEEPSQLLQYGRTFGTEMGEVRWDKVAEGLGCQGFHVEKAADLDVALAEAKRHPGPSVVCVRTDRDANRNVPMDGMMRFVEVYQGPLG